jgi:myo-inositol-1(or 4)-monophosphatase
MVRKGTNIPYILHPMEAAAIVGSMTSDPEILAAAVLHDVLEDTPVTAAVLEDRFGSRVAELVAAESEDKRDTLPAEETWRVRKEETIRHLRETQDPGEKMIALGDKLSNIRAMYRDHLEIGDRLWDRFNQKDKREHHWYYASIAEALNMLEKTLAWKEFDTLVRAVFGEMESY